MFDSKVFSEIGFMDEAYFVYFDDTDFFYRVKKNGNFKLLVNQKIKSISPNYGESINDISVKTVFEEINKIIND